MRLFGRFSALWPGIILALSLPPCARADQPIPPFDTNAPEFNVKSVVDGGFVNIRTGPGMGWKIVTQIPAGASGLKRTGPCRNSDDGETLRPWCPVAYKVYKGFVSTFNLEAVASETPAAAVPDEDKGKAGGSSVESTGSGFFVSSEGHILTNAHVVGECRAITAARAGTPQMPAKLLAADITNDLALLQIADARPPVVPELITGARTGASVAVYGFPLSETLSTNGNFTTGSVSATTGLLDNTSVLQITAPVQPGNSGGPLLDEYGNGIGVVFSKLNVIAMAPVTKDIAQNVNFAIKASVARTFLEARGVPLLAQTGTIKLSNPDLADRARSFTVLITCRGRNGP